jgi:hypothetical protein
MYAMLLFCRDWAAGGPHWTTAMGVLGCGVAALAGWLRVVYGNMPAQSGQKNAQQWARKERQGKGKGIRRSGSAAAQMPTVWLAEPGCRVLERIVS